MAEEAGLVETLCAVCGSPGSKKCGRCGVEVYCSAACQRKAWPAHKAACASQATPEAEISDHLRAGRLYSARRCLEQMPEAALGRRKLLDELERQLGAGVHAEVVQQRLRLADVAGKGLGYLAAVDIQAGDDLLFDTAFCSTPVVDAKDTEQEAHHRIAEKAITKGNSPKRRTDPIADARCDFFRDRLKDLATKHNINREWLDAMPDPTQQIQVLMCSIAECNLLPCTEDPGYVALYGTLARMNHSCAPNAALSSTRSTALVRAIAPIAAGEEVTISCLPPELLEAAGDRRRAELLESRGFTCICRRCAAEGDAAGSS